MRTIFHGQTNLLFGSFKAELQIFLRCILSWTWLFGGTLTIFRLQKNLGWWIFSPKETSLAVESKTFQKQNLWTTVYSSIFIQLAHANPTIAHHFKQKLTRNKRWSILPSLWRSTSYVRKTYEFWWKLPNIFIQFWGIKAENNFERWKQNRNFRGTLLIF